MVPVDTGVTQEEDPPEQKLGVIQVSISVVEQSVLVRVMVCPPPPVQDHAWVQETVSAAPTPPCPDPVHCTVLLPGRVHVQL